MVFNYKSNDVLIPASIVGIFQEGGEIMEGEPAMQEDPMEMLMQLASAGMQGDCESATAACQMIIEMLQAQMGAEEAPQGGMEQPMQ